MNKKKDIEYRFEKKFVFKSQKKIVEDLVYKNSGVFYKKYPSRRINNIYFDDFEESLLDMNIEGISRRIKVRIRWYENEIEKSILEIKKKNNQKNYKLYYPLKKKFELNSSSNTYLKSFIKKNDEINNLEYLQPIIQNKYKRDYFESYLEDIRLTIDYQLNYKNLKLEKKFNQIENLVIVELKYSEPSKMLREISSNLETRMSKFSKYVSCATEDFSNFI